MPNPTRGTEYRARSADRHETLRLFGALGMAMFTVVALALIAVVAHPPLLELFL
jgi:hypothetical protein